MKTFREYLKESTDSTNVFKTRNFPRKGNEHITGAGFGGTNHVENELNKTVGFGLIGDSEYYGNDKNLYTITSDKRVFITLPGRLYLGRDVSDNILNTSIFTKIGLNSSKISDANGYMRISRILKPKTESQPRVKLGSSYQSIVAKYLEDDYGVTIDYVAPIGSTSKDIKAHTNNEEFVVEVKGIATPTTRIYLFDKSVSRTNRNIDVDTATKIISDGKFNNFSRYIDTHRIDDETIGWPGDEGVDGTSGKLPEEMAMVSDKSKIVEIVKTILIPHLSTGGDNYIAFYIDKTGDKLLYYIDGNNSLNANKFNWPHIKSLHLVTGGAGSSGNMRVAFKIVLA
jgi:hypothetical protein